MTTPARRSLATRADVGALEVLTSRDELAALQPAWHALMARSRAPNVFLTWEWITAWLDLVGPFSDLRVLVVRDPLLGEPVGVVPFVIRGRPAAGPALWRELVLVGSWVTAPDHLDCLAARGWESYVSGVVTQWLRGPGSGRDWDLVCLDGVSPRSALATMLLAATPKAATAIWSVPAPYVPLPETWEEYEAGLARNFSRNLRRRLRKLEAEVGPPTFETASDPAAARAGLADLVRLHQSVRTLAGDRGAFDSPLRCRLYEEIVARFLARGWLRLYTLRVEERALAAALCFHFGGKVWYYQTGYDLSLQQYGPGYLITRHALQRAIEERAREVDFLRGDHSYKYEWNAEPRTILRLRVASTLAGRVLAPATHWLRAAKHGWKAWVRKSAVY